jgi:hypothetical protein
MDRHFPFITKQRKEEGGSGDNAPTAAETTRTAQLADAPVAQSGTATAYHAGNYQLSVHIIECSEMISPSGSGFVSPAVFVEVLGQKVYTKLKSKVSGCVFNDSFYIQLKDLNESKIQDVNIVINVLDRSHRMISFGSSKTIGSFSIDLETVYQSSGHEIYRQWVPLISPTTADISGKLLLSLTLLGPGDRAVVHDRKKEIEEEKSQRQRGGTVDAVELRLPPTLPQKLRYLVVEIFRAEGIPVFDSATASHTRASVGVDFDQHRCETVHTDAADLLGNENNNVDYLTALWLPYMDPSFSNRVQLRLLKHHTGNNIEVQSSSHCPSMQLRCIKHAMEGNAIPAGQLDPTQLFWVNMYGAPVPETFTGRQTQKRDKNTYPESASAYRGRLLVRLRISEKLPIAQPAKSRVAAGEVFKCAITPEYLSATASLTANSNQSTLFRAPGIGGTSNSSENAGVTTKNLPQSQPSYTGKESGRANQDELNEVMGLPRPKSRRYVLRAMVYAGHTFPQRSRSKSDQYLIELRLMDHRLQTRELQMKSSYAAWNDPLLLKGTFELPEDTAMLPDLFLYVLHKGKESTPVSFKRISLGR